MLALRHLPRLPTSQLDISLAILGISQGNINNMEELKNNKVRKLLSKKRLSTRARGTCIFIMHTFIQIFYFNHLGESALLCGQTVPEAIHNQVAIKLLKSCLLT